MSDRVYPDPLGPDNPSERRGSNDRRLGFFRKHDPEVEFLPAALEVLETPASPAGRAVALLICLFFVIALVWAVFGRIDIIATATGKIVSSTRTKTIQPLDTGVVRAIHVQDGQAVKAGDILIEIDPTISRSERDRLQSELTGVELDIARLRATLKMRNDPTADFSPPETASAQDLATQRSRLISQVQEIKSKLLSYDQQIAQNSGNRAAVQATIDKLTQSMPMLAERARIRETLSQRGFGTKLEMLNAEQDLVEHQQELRVQQGRLAEASAGVASLREQRQQNESEFRQKTLDNLTQNEQRAESLQQQLVQAKQRFKLQTLTAPVDGTVQQLAIHTVGGVVTPAQALLMIVPADSRLEVEAMVSNRDIGFVHRGQHVEIKVDTFNFTKYGFIHGIILSVSHDAITRQNFATSANQSQSAQNDTSEPQGQEWVYTTRIGIDRRQMQIGDRAESLVPGMAVTAEIKTGSQRVIQYLLSPLYKNQQEAMHER